MPDIFSQPESEEKETPQTNQGTIITPHPHTLNLFSTFAHHPQGVLLAEQEENEQIILLLRKDFITNVPWITITFILLMLPAPAYEVLSVISLQAISLSGHFLIALALFYYII